MSHSALSGSSLKHEVSAIDAHIRARVIKFSLIKNQLLS